MDLQAILNGAIGSAGIVICYGIGKAILSSNCLASWRGEHLRVRIGTGGDRRFVNSASASTLPPPAAAERTETYVALDSPHV
jgi:hypothetical protein